MAQYFMYVTFQHEDIFMAEVLNNSSANSKENYYLFMSDNYGSRLNNRVGKILVP